MPDINTAPKSCYKKGLGAGLLIGSALFIASCTAVDTNAQEETFTPASEIPSVCQQTLPYILAASDPRANGNFGVYGETSFSNNISIYTSSWNARLSVSQNYPIDAKSTSASLIKAIKNPETYSAYDPFTNLETQLAAAMALPEVLKPMIDVAEYLPKPDANGQYIDDNEIDQTTNVVKAILKNKSNVPENVLDNLKQEFYSAQENTQKFDSNEIQRNLAPLVEVLAMSLSMSSDENLRNDLATVMPSLIEKVKKDEVGVLSFTALSQLKNSSKLLGIDFDNLNKDFGENFRLDNGLYGIDGTNFEPHLSYLAQDIGLEISAEPLQYILGVGYTPDGWLRYVSDPTLQTTYLAHLVENSCNRESRLGGESVDLFMPEAGEKVSIREAYMICYLQNEGTGYVEQIETEDPSSILDELLVESSPEGCLSPAVVGATQSNDKFHVEKLNEYVSRRSLSNETDESSIDGFKVGDAYAASTGGVPTLLDTAIGLIYTDAPEDVRRTALENFRSSPGDSVQLYRFGDGEPTVSSLGVATYAALGASDNIADILVVELGSSQ